MTTALDRLAALPSARLAQLAELLEMEAEGGGWIPPAMFDEQPEEAAEQAEACQRAASAIRSLLANRA